MQCTKSQSDQILKQICSLLHVPRHHLRLAATAKGLIRGHVRLLEPPQGSEAEVAEALQSTWVDCMDALEVRGHLIQPSSAHVLRVESNARVVLVVEKETVFHRLLTDGLLSRLSPLIVVTGRGYPDLATRHLLKRIEEDCCTKKLLLLVDADPSGLAIALTYAIGPESPGHHDAPTFPEASLITCFDVEVASTDYGLPPTATLALTVRDRSMLENLKKRLVKSHLAPDWGRAAEGLLQQGAKFELDSLCGLSHLVDAAVRAANEATL